MITTYYYVRETYMTKFDDLKYNKIINTSNGVAELDLSKFVKGYNLFDTIEQAKAVRDNMIDYVLTNYSHEVLHHLRYSIISLELDETIIDERIPSLC